MRLDCHRWKNTCLDIATSILRKPPKARQGGIYVGLFAQSIIGATEKRRESGAGVAVIGGIGASGNRWGEGREFIRNEATRLEASPVATVLGVSGAIFMGCGGYLGAGVAIHWLRTFW